MWPFGINQSSTNCRRINNKAGKIIDLKEVSQEIIMGLEKLNNSILFPGETLFDGATN